MLFLNKDLIELCGFSERTYYRKVSALKAKNVFTNSLDGNYMTLDEAKAIAEKLGFTREFEQYLKQKK